MFCEGKIQKREGEIIFREGVFEKREGVLMFIVCLQNSIHAFLVGFTAN